MDSLLSTFSGEIKGFTGIDDPYEEPINAEIQLTTTDCSTEDNARKIISHLMDRTLLLETTDERNFYSP